MYLCIRIQTSWDVKDVAFGVWCNGNTTDSGPVILGSSPSTPTRTIAKYLQFNTWRFSFLINSREIPD